MTDENYNYRTSQALLRNQFPRKGKLKIPIIPKIVYVDYERSSWRYMNYEQSLPKEDLDCYKIGGAISRDYDIMEPYRISKGGGSAYGGKWRPNPNKPQDARYWGKSGEIKTTIMNNGDIFKTKIGSDGRAEIERHETDHNRGDKHTNPHDHKIDWNNPDEHPCPRSSDQLSRRCA